MKESEDLTHNSDKRDRLWNKEYMKVMTSNFLLFFAFYLLTPLLPVYLTDRFVADKDTIGVVLSGYVIATLVIRPFSGFIVDSFNRRKVLSACFFAFFICFAGYIGASTLLLFAIVRTLHGIPFGATTVANSTVAIDVLPSSRRGEGIGYYGLSNNIAMATAPSAGIYLYGTTGDFNLLFWCSFVLAFVGFVTTTRVKTSPRTLIKSKPRMSLDHFFLTRAWMMAVNIGLFGVCWGVMSNYVAIFAIERMNITGGTGLFFMILSIGLVLARLFGSRSLRRGKMTRSCARGVILSSIGFTLFALSINEFTFYLSALFVGLGNGQMYPAFLNMFVNVARHDQRGTANSSILISWDAGMGLGILLGGFIAQYIGYSAAFVTVAAIQILGAAMFLTRTSHFYQSRKLPD